MTKIIPIIEKQSESAPLNSMTDDKHFAMAEAMRKLARPLPQKNLTQINIESVTRGTRFAFIMMPEWGVFFPPYNIARLSAITRAAGYETLVFDVNIQAFQKFKDSAEIGYNPWDGSREFHWTEDWYHKELHPHMESLFQEYVEKIVNANPKVIGFSLYYTNEQPAKWMAQQLKQRLPNCVILAGGPQVQKSYFTPTDDFDHIVQGEGEGLLLEILDRIERQETIGARYIKQLSGQRIDLDSLPFPDYSDYNFNDYTIPNGISAEISRGCIAKCTFCAETLFWKYRGRLSGSILDEIEHQYRTHGINVVWFIDSLVNGNLKELRAFALGVVQRNININWQGYSRCDERMDLDYYKDLKASGCHLLNYGIESGSQKVLDSMKKGTAVAEIEQNLRDGVAVGIEADTNWIIGFPNEDPEAFADTMTMMWRNRNNGLRVVGTGLTLMQDPDTDIGINADKYKITKESLLGAWCTSNLDNTSIHRKIRIKSIEVFLTEINKPPMVKKHLWIPTRPNLMKDYNTQYTADLIQEVEYEKFDYQIIKPNINLLANSVVNEIWPLLRLIWRARGAYSITLKFDPASDLQEFGHRLASDYSATHNFTIDKSGNWSADFVYDLKLPKDPWHPWSAPNNLQPWKDMSFNYHYQGQGHWE